MVGQELLAETVEGLYHGFGGSRVRTFVPVLVEHETRDVLAGRQAAASHWADGSRGRQGPAGR